MVTNAAETHLSRAHAFLNDAKRSTDIADKSRYLASAVENAVGIVEAFRSQVEDRIPVYGLADDILPRFRLLKRIRIHEFHRSPLPVFPPELLARAHVQYMQGPITLSSGTEPNSWATVQLTPQGPKFETGGSGRVGRKAGGHEKEIWLSDGEVWDDQRSDWVGIEPAVEEFLCKAPDFIRAASHLPQSHAG